MVITALLSQATVTAHRSVMQLTQIWLIGKVFAQAAAGKMQLLSHKTPGTWATREKKLQSLGRRQLVSNFEWNSSQLSCYLRDIWEISLEQKSLTNEIFHDWMKFSCSLIQHTTTSEAEVEWYIALLNCKIHPSHHENLVSCRSFFSLLLSTLISCRNIWGKMRWERS